MSEDKALGAPEIYTRNEKIFSFKGAGSSKQKRTGQELKKAVRMTNNGKLLVNITEKLATL